MLWITTTYLTIYDLFERIIVQFGRNFYFKIRRDHENISYERRAYESVDDGSLS